MWIKVISGYVNLKHVLKAQVDGQRQVVRLYPIVNSEEQSDAQVVQGANFEKARGHIADNWCPLGDDWYLNVDRYALVRAESADGHESRTVYLADRAPDVMNPTQAQNAPYTAAVLRWLEQRA